MLIGISDFKTQVEKGYYVDKTSILDELAPRINTSTGIIVNRPRRFGKSLMLSMIDAFFNDRYDNAALFAPFAIASSPTMRYLNSFPVINLSFKNVAGAKPEEVLSAFQSLLADLYRFHRPDIYDCLDADQKSYYDAIVSGKASLADYALCLNRLCVFVHAAKGKKPIVLIDEYDAPIERVFDERSYSDVVDFLKSLFVAAFKDVSDYSFAMLTGVFSITKGTLGSGLNNLPVDSAVSRAFTKNYFGFNDEDMRRLCADFAIPESELEELRRNYGGYVFAGEEVHNPWSILNYIQSREYATYWNMSGSNATFAKALGKTDLISEETLLALLQDGQTVHLDPSSSYDTIYSSSSNLILYLVMAGYFTVQKEGFADYHVYTPNLETRSAFLEEIKRKYRDQEGLDRLAEIRRAFFSGDANLLATQIKSVLLSALSYYDFTSEKNYQIMVGTMLALAFSECRCKCEVIAGTGRCDILVQSRNRGSFGAVIEIKYHASPISATRLSDSARRALSQIEKNDYLDELINADAKPIYAYGFAFMKNKVAVQSKQIR